MLQHLKRFAIYIKTILSNNDESLHFQNLPIPQEGKPSFSVCVNGTHDAAKLGLFSFFFFF